jgi:hypothetical protein
MLASIIKYSQIRDGSVKDLSIEDIYKSFGRILILCTKSSIRDKQTYSLIPMPVSIIKNTFIKNFLHLVDYEYLNK